MSTMTATPVQLIDCRSVRLTRRGRLTILALGLIAVLLVGVFLGSGSVATEQPAPTTVVQVAPGETMWDIASPLTPAGEDVRGVIFDIKRLNGLESSALDAGQRLRVPALG